MINFYSGTPGSGKSLHVARIISNYYRKGKNIIANFEIVESSIPAYHRKKHGTFVCISNDQFLGTFGAHHEISAIQCLYGYAANFHISDASGKMLEGQTLLVLDEAQLLYNSRTWQASDRAVWVEFFTQHRKYGFEVIIISQFDRLIDRQIRGCFEYECVHRKINNYKWFGKLLGTLCGGNLFICVTRWYGLKGKDSKVYSYYFIGQKKYYRIYNSYKIFGSSAGTSGGSA